MSAYSSSPKHGLARFIHKHFSIGLLLGLALCSTAYANEPNAKNDLPIRANPTATVTGVCYKLDQKEYSISIQATCYSEINRAVVVLVSGNARSMSGQKVAEFIVSEFGRSHVPAVAFLELENMEGISITYLLNGDPYGAYSGKDWRDGFKILKAHSVEAWHK